MFKYPEELNFLEIGQRPQKSTQVSLKGKVCVITGATSGVGYESAKVLASHQAHLVLVVRNLEKAKPIQQELLLLSAMAVDILQADFSHLEDVEKTAQEILQNYARLDILINCAGMHSTRLKRLEAGYDEVFLVNHLAPFLFTQRLTPLLIKSAPSRILQINSEGHRFNGLDIEDLNWHHHLYTGLRGYGASKTAQLLCLWEQADRLKQSAVSINAMHPGDVRSNIGQNNGFLYRWFSKLIIQKLLKDPAISGQAIYYLVAEPSLEKVSGKFFHLTHEELPAKHARDRNLSHQVYLKSCELTGINPE